MSVQGKSCTAWFVIVWVLTATIRGQGIVPETAEPNDVRARPVPFQPGMQGEGALAGQADVDAWRIVLMRPATIEVWTGPGREDACDDTVLTVVAADQRVLASSDDADRRGRHAACRCSLPAGMFHLVVRGNYGSRGSYTIECREVAIASWTVEGDEPNGDPRSGGRPTPIDQGGVADGIVERAGDHDWYELRLASPQRLLARTHAALPMPLTDPVLELWWAEPRSGRPVWLSTDDDSGGERQASIELQLDAGTYWLVVRDAGPGNGGYQLSCRNSAVVADFGGACGAAPPFPQLQVTRDRQGMATELPLFGSTFVVDGSASAPGDLVCRLVGVRFLPVPTPLEGGTPCPLLVDPLLFDFAVSDANARFRQAIPLPARWPVLGQHLLLQALVLPGSGGVALSNVLSASCGHAW